MSYLTELSLAVEHADRLDRLTGGWRPLQLPRLRGRRSPAPTGTEPIPFEAIPLEPRRVTESREPDSRPEAA